MEDVFWLAPLFPLAAAALLAALPARDRVAAPVALPAIAAATVVSAIALAGVWDGGRAAASVDWLQAGDVALELRVAAEPLGAIIALVVCVVSLAVFAYAAGYMRGSARAGVFFAELSLFVAAMLGIVLAADLITLFIAWELVGVTSYLLIGFHFDETAAGRSSLKALLVTRAGDLMLLAGVLLLILEADTSDIGAAMDAASGGGIAGSTLSTIAALVFAGAAVKSAQFPVQGWLADAMVAPTPVSALLHSATMVAAGVFVVARLFPLFESADGVLTAVAWLGATSALFAGAIALVETDLKRALAFSTVSQLGMMYVALGAGSVVAAIALLIAHALYKATLFMASGAVDRGLGSRELSQMGGLRDAMPLTAVTFGFAAVALAGLPVTAALPAKDAVMSAAWDENLALFAVVLLASLLTALYATRLAATAFLGQPLDWPARPETPPLALALPAAALALLLVPGLLIDARVVGHPLAGLLGGETPDALAATALTLAVAVAGVAIALAARYAWPRAATWPALRPVAPALRREGGIAYVYGAVASAGVWVASAWSWFDRSVFDRVAGGAAAMLRSARRSALSFDVRVFDGAADRATDGTLALIRAGLRFDLRAVDGAVRDASSGLLAFSQQARRVQTGRIDNYLVAVVAWGLGLAFVAAIAFIWT